MPKTRMLKRLQRWQEQGCHASRRPHPRPLDVWRTACRPPLHPTVDFGRTAWLVRQAVRPPPRLADRVAIHLSPVGRSKQPLVEWPSTMPSAQANHRVERPSADERHGGRYVQTHGRPAVSGQMSLDMIFPEDVQSDKLGQESQSTLLRSFLVHHLLHNHVSMMQI
jgi:hypothetical protein